MFSPLFSIAPMVKSSTGEGGVREGGVVRLKEEQFMGEGREFRLDCASSTTKEPASTKRNLTPPLGTMTFS